MSPQEMPTFYVFLYLEETREVKLDFVLAETNKLDLSPPLAHVNRDATSMMTYEMFDTSGS